MNGVDYMALDTDDMIQFLYSCVVDDLVSMGTSRQEVREEVDKKLAEVLMIYNNRIIQDMKTREAAGEPVDMANAPEAEPFVLSPQMQQALGLRVYGKSGDKP